MVPHCNTVSLRILREARLCHLESFRNDRQPLIDPERFQQYAEIRAEGQRIAEERQIDEETFQRAVERRSEERAIAKELGALNDQFQQEKEDEQWLLDVRASLEEIPGPADLSGRAQVIERAITDTRTIQMLGGDRENQLAPGMYAASWITLRTLLHTRLQNASLPLEQRTQMETDIHRLNALDSLPTAIRAVRFQAIRERYQDPPIPPDDPQDPES